MLRRSWKRVSGRFAKFGEAVIVIDQEPSKLSNSILAKHLHQDHLQSRERPGHASHRRSHVASMKRRNRQSTSSRLGHGVVSLKGRVGVPLHVRFPKSGVRKGLTGDADLIGLSASSAPDSGSYTGLR